MAIYLVRHAQDDEEVRGGWSQLGLIEEGFQQAKQLGEYLKQHREEFNIKTLISSDLKRAVQTAHEIEKFLNLKAIYSSEWREMNNGLLAGMLNAEALEKYPNLFFNTLKMDESYPEGESPKEFYHRIKMVFGQIAECDAAKNQNMMVVTHSGVINIIYHLVNEIDWTNQSPKLSKISCTGIHKLEYRNGVWNITDCNNTRHLMP